MARSVLFLCVILAAATSTYGYLMDFEGSTNPADYGVSAFPGHTPTMAIITGSNVISGNQSLSTTGGLTQIPKESFAPGTLPDQVNISVDARSIGNGGTWFWFTPNFGNTVLGLYREGGNFYVDGFETTGWTYVGNTGIAWPMNTPLHFDFAVDFAAQRYNLSISETGNPSNVLLAMSNLWFSTLMETPADLKGVFLWDGVFDNFLVTPEPATLVLLVLGSFAGWTRRLKC